MACKCKENFSVALLEIKNKVNFDEHQAKVPAECSLCGEGYTMIYNEAGVKDKDGEYVYTF